MSRTYPLVSGAYWGVSAAYSGVCGTYPGGYVRVKNRVVALQHVPIHIYLHVVPSYHSARTLFPMDGERFSLERAAKALMEDTQGQVNPYKVWNLSHTVVVLHFFRLYDDSFGAHNLWNTTRTQPERNWGGRIWMYVPDHTVPFLRRISSVRPIGSA